MPLLVTAHGTDAFALRGWFTQTLKHLILKRCVAWTANTVSTAAAVSLDAGVPQARIIPMGVDVALFSQGDPAALRRELAEGEYLILFIGRLIESKGCRDLVHALSLLPDKTRLRTTLWIVGDGDQRNQFDRTAQELSVGEKVRFFGAVSQQILPDFYAAADLVLVPSKPGSSGETEGQGLVVLEAFAARACVLATRVGGIPSMVQDHVTGVLVEPGNPKELSRAIETLLNEPTLRQQITDNAYADVCERYSWTRVASEFKALYGEIVSTVRL